MQKLLALLPKPIYQFLFETIKLPHLVKGLKALLSRYFLHQFNASRALNIYIRSLGLIFILAIGAILFQYNDLILTDTMLPVPNLQTHPMLLNVFRFISPIYLQRTCLGK